MKKLFVSSMLLCASCLPGCAVDQAYVNSHTREEAKDSEGQIGSHLPRAAEKDGKTDAAKPAG